MSDYGYRSDPPPEDERSFGDAGHSGGAYGSASPRNRSYGSASNNPPSNGDYGWGGDSHPGTGSYGGSAAPRPGSYGGPASGSASVGRASGSASVGGGSGRASVGGASGSASVGGAGGTGRASVGGASGSASVGSASVGSASVSSAQPVSPASGGTGRATVAGKRRAGRGGPDGPLDKDDLEGQRKLKKKRRRRKIYAGLIAVAVLFVAAATVVGTWFYQKVPPLEDLRQNGEPTAIYYADGETQVAAYGESYSLQVEDPDKMPETVKNALIASEDRKFYKHSGVDYVGTMRALVNNVTGGSTQGASTITQQLAGIVAGIRDDISYGRKAKEAVMAMKLEQEYSKDEIITFYLDMAYFGRGAYGVAAASELYFDVPVAELTPAQAAYVIMQVKSPNGYYDPYYTDYYDEDATKTRWTYVMDAMAEEGYISQSDRDAAEMPVPTKEFESRGSWGHDTPTGFITNPIDGYIWDELESRYGLSQAEFYGDEPGTGGYEVVTTIDKELQDVAVQTASRGQLKVITDDDGNFLNEEGEIVTDRADAEVYVNDDGFYEFENSNEEAALYDQNLSLASSLVAVDPATGEVLAYYGGDNGLAVDKAGEENPHPPSSTFKMITAATAMLEGNASVESWWDGSSPREFESLKGQDKEAITNHGMTESNHDVTLTTALRKSLNTPMYAIADRYGATTVLANAVKMGITQMTFNENGTAVTYHFRIEDDESISYSRTGAIETADGWVTDDQGNIDYNAPMTTTIDEIASSESGEMEWAPLDLSSPRAPADYQIGFGQYPSTVRDMAAVYATIANDGTHVETHFVKEVYKNGELVEPTRELQEIDAIPDEVARDLQWVGSEIDGSSEPLDRDFTGKTGTWEATGKYEGNAHTWYNGAIPQLSVSSWVGNAYSESAPLLNKDGGTGNTYGATLSEPVWNQFMRAAIEVKGYDKAEWGPKMDYGTMIVDDILNEDDTIDANSAYCAEYGDEDSRCGTTEDDDEQCGEGDDGNNGGGNDENCGEEGGGEDDGGGDTGGEPTGDETTTPSGDETSDDGGDDCSFFGCPGGDETTPPDPGGDETSTEPDNPDGV
ncbi:transglycosylase domain-containing protein [Glycomyces arizonensis]|uniref:transglycosylase domain-containing protein n=1 Tax=Glycomyces arizonensis TaxID=256035 RepID=UPI0004028BE6|nr:transglycosylase domain-containing protein [Glycomyces arizonensis]